MKVAINLIDNKKGSSYIITVLAMTVIMGFSALVIDMGLIFIERTKLSNAIDAAVLAGCHELPSKPTKAVNKAYEYIRLNGFNTEDVQIMVEEENTLLRANGAIEVDAIFAKVLGIMDSTVRASAAARIGPVTTVHDGIRPLAVEEQNFEYGQEVILKDGASDGTTGNYGSIALGGTGASIYQYNIIHGYEGQLTVGEIVDTETGNMAQPTIKGVETITDSDYSTFDAYSRDSLRLWTLPIVNTLEVEGRKSIQIVGFGEFFVEDVIKNGGQTEVIGRFIEFTSNGDIGEGQVDFGLKGVKLIQ